MLQQKERKIECNNNGKIATAMERLQQQQTGKDCNKHGKIATVTNMERLQQQEASGLQQHIPARKIE